MTKLFLVLHFLLYFYYLIPILYTHYDKQKYKTKKEDGKLGFVSEYGIFDSSLLRSECGRFMMDPIKDYGLTQKQVDQMVKVNELEEELGIWSDFV